MPMKKRPGARRLDVELTNRCNARCSFCPRDATPQTGMMSLETFDKVLDRALELDVLPVVGSAGQGEPCLHPQLLEFAQLAHRRGVGYGITTNGSLLTRELSEGLHEAELEHITFSFGDLGEDYEEVYALNFERSYENVMYFLELNEKREEPCRTVLSMVLHDINRDKRHETVKFWKQRGIHAILQFEQNNRGGACENGLYFPRSRKYLAEAAEIMKTEGVPMMCTTPFFFLFVGWDGQYYVCCNDYRKTTPLGSVFDYGIVAMDEIKRGLVGDGGMTVEACRECDRNPINEVREKLFELERGFATEDELFEQVASLRERQLRMFGG